MCKELLRLVSILTVVAIAVPCTVLSQEWPTKPIRVVVPVPPGASNDLIARLVATRLADALAQPVVVENRAGAGGTIGTALVARAVPDGYTLLLTSTSHVTSLFLTKDLPYHPVKDFTPIIAAAEVMGCIVLHPSVPVNSVKELIDYSIRNPGKVAYGSPGVGTTLHLIGELFNMVTGAKLVHVPYKGTAPAMADLLGGQIPAVITSVSAIPAAQAGKVKVLAILEPKRYPGMPGVPSINETLPGFQKPVSWFGILGPARIPQPLVSRLNAEVAKALHSPDVRSKLEASALGILASSPEEFSEMLRSGVDSYGKIVKAVGIRPE
jgi:tripartite-type tricarboxylate transporter receptor subunit TctC